MSGMAGPRGVAVPEATRSTYRPVPPYVFTRHLERFTVPGEPSPGLFSGGAYRVLLRVPGVGYVAAEAVFRGEPWSPRVEAALWAPGGGAVEAAAEALMQHLRVYVDYNEFLRRLEPWPRLRRLAERYAGLRPGRCLGVYEALVDAVVKQRVALRSALRVQARLVERYGLCLERGGRLFCSYPVPERLASASIEELRSLGLTRLKAEALRGIAAAELEGRLPSPGEVARDPWGVAEELTRLRGVGRWTAELAAAMVHPFFPLGPFSDLAVRRGLAAVLGSEPGPGEVRRLVSDLGDYAGLLLYLAAYDYEESKRARR